MKKIAVIGAGFAGLGATYHLLKRGGDVTLFDGKGIGQGASGIASGLLHPYPGESARLSWMGNEGMKETKHLLGLVGQSVYKESGILKIAVTPKQKNAFQKLAKRYDDIEWWDEEKCHQFVQGSHFLPGIFVRSGITVHAPLYLKGLWKVCETLGARLVEKNVSPAELKGYDEIIIAAGGGIRNFMESASLGLRFNKGQILVCKKPEYFIPKSSVIGKGYIALSHDASTCYLGSTYEREYLTEKPCQGAATDLIFGQVSQFLPSYGYFDVMGCRADMRVTSPYSRLPIVQTLREGLHVFTALGSRGLLYHALLGKQLAEKVL